MLYTKNAVIILCGIRFPENVGMVARACANLGCQYIRLVKPERYEMFKAWPQATRIGRPILEKVQIFENISDAASDLYALFGTSARLGDRRGGISPEEFASQTMDFRSNGQENELYGVIFGPEDRGLSNKELSLCKDIVHIPACKGASSFNIAQSVLIILYELYKNGCNTKKPISPHNWPKIKIGDLERLENSLKEVLIQISLLPEKDPDYFFAQWHDMLYRMQLKRNEYDALMGMCRQIRNFIKK